jgi:hypothetical protein
MIRRFLRSLAVARGCLRRIPGFGLRLLVRGSQRRLGKVNTFHFLPALSYRGLILAGVSTGDHGKSG